MSEGAKGVNSDLFLFKIGHFRGTKFDQQQNFRQIFGFVFYSEIYIHSAENFDIYVEDESKRIHTSPAEFM